VEKGERNSLKEPGASENGSSLGENIDAARKANTANYRVHRAARQTLFTIIVGLAALDKSETVEGEFANASQASER